jgi:PAS domain S-box-containing protein
MDLLLAHREVLSVLPDAVVVANAKGEIRYANQAAETMLGWPAGELTGNPLTAIVPRRLRARHQIGFSTFIATRTPTIMGRPIRLPALRRDGSEIDVDLTLGVLSSSDEGELIIGSLRDLRDRVELERQIDLARFLRAATTAATKLTNVLDVEYVLRTAVEVLTVEYDAALARIWLWDPEACLLHLRASGGLSRRVHGSSREHVDPASHPYKLGKVVRERRPFLENDLSGDIQFNQAWVAEERLQAAAVMPLLIAGELMGVLVSFFRQPLQEEVFEVLLTLSALIATAINDAQLYEKTRRALRARDEILAIVSHDLRNPLGAITLSAEHLLREGARELPQQAQRIQRCVKRMEQLTSDLLDLSVIEAGRLTIAVSEQQVRAIAVEAVEGLKPRADEKHVRLANEAERSAAVVTCDFARVVQALSNLIGNAIKFTDPGGEVIVHVVEHVDRITYVISDTGSGIDEIDLPHIFDRYWKKSRSGTGSVGLGLAIAKGLAEAHGGTLCAESRPGHGSTFSFTLPRKAEGPRAAA